MSLSVQVKLKQNVKWRHFFAPDRSYLCVLDLVFQRLLQEVEGIFLSVGLDHDVPCLSHLDLEPEQAQEKYVSVSVTQTRTSTFLPPSHLHLSVLLCQRLVLSLHLQHLFPHPLHLVAELSVGSQKILVVDQQSTHLKPAAEEVKKKKKTI